MLRTSPEEQLARAVVLPHLLACGLGAVVVVLGLFGRDPQWQDAPVNLSTAISTGDIAQAVRRIERGEDPTAVHLVPGDDADDPPVPMTPLDAAVVNGELEMVRAIVDRRRPLEAGERHKLACVAMMRDGEEIAEFLIGRVPAAEECAGVEQDHP